MHKTEDMGRAPRHEVLERLRLRDLSYCQSLLSAPWGIEVPAAHGLTFYVFVARGSCVLRIAGRALELGEGAFVLLPGGVQHALLDSVHTSGVPIDELGWQVVHNRCIVRAGGEGAETHLVTGSMDFEPHPLLDGLPEVIEVSAEARAREPWLGHTMSAMLRELDAARTGTEVILSRLAEAVAVGAIRHWLEQAEPDTPGVAMGMSDAAVRRALKLIHDAPGQQWTVAELARRVGMSRTSFSERFTTLVGVPPITYWSRWRLGLAAKWLRDDTASIEEASERLGYSSRAAFSRAFRATLGTSPGAMRRQRKSSPPVRLNDLLADARRSPPST